MSQSFRRFFVQFRLDPFLPLMLAGFIPAFLLAFLMLEELWLAVSLVWVLLCDLLSKAAARWKLPGISQPLTPDFYAVRAWNGTWSIFQRRPPGGREMDCRALLEGLVREQHILPTALPPGRYQTVTHDTVLRRLKAMPDAVIQEVMPVYTATLEHICRHMTGGRCRRCKKACPFLAFRKGTRPFYYVRFCIKE